MRNLTHVYIQREILHFWSSESLIFVQSPYLFHRLWTMSFVKHIVNMYIIIPSNRPDTFEQVEVPLDIFGKASVYLKGWCSTVINNSSVCESIARKPFAWHDMWCSIIAIVSVYSLPSPWYIYIYYCVLAEEMKVQLQLYDGRALAAFLPKHVTCTIEETQLPMKGLTSAPRYVFFLRFSPFWYIPLYIL